MAQHDTRARGAAAATASFRIHAAALRVAAILSILVIPALPPESPVARADPGAADPAWTLMSAALHPGSPAGTFRDGPQPGQGTPVAEIVPAFAHGPVPICEFCNFAVPPIALERFTARMASDAGTRISDWNLALIARADSLRLTGSFGPAETPEAGAQAARYFKYHALTAMDFIGYLSTQQRVAWESDETEISPFYYQFANPGIYPVWGLRRVLLGGGAFCMDFEVPRGFEADRLLGTRPVRLSSERVDEQGGEAPAWSLEMDVPGNGKAHYLFSERYKGRVRQVVVEEDGRPLKVTVLEEIEGFYIKKWGTHRCGAIVLWRSQLPDGELPTEGDRIGGAAYFPGLRLNLPAPIPDVDLDDLRAFPGFQPLIAADHCGRSDFPDWLGVGADGAFQRWDSEGEIPRAVRDWFTDL